MLLMGGGIRFAFEIVGFNCGRVSKMFGPRLENGNVGTRD